MEMRPEEYERLMFFETAREKAAEDYQRNPPDAKDGRGHGETGDSGQSTADLTAFVQNLLQQMQARFQTMSESIITKIDEMGSRIDDLEKSISDLTKEMGVEVPSSKSGGDEKPE